MRVDHIRLLLHAVPVTIIIQWIPGHSNIPGNKLADRAAKQAAELPPTADLAIKLSSAVKVVRVHSRCRITHDRTKEIYSHYRPSIDAEQITKRADEVLLARVRASHHPAFQAYLHRLDPDVDPTCPSSNEDQHTLQYWLISCPAGGRIRQQMFGNHRGRLEWLVTHSKTVVVYARKTLVNLGI